jgi:hypothetical protein
MLPDIGQEFSLEEKRQSMRWAIDRPLKWRLHGGRRVRECNMCERSLHGMVLKLDAPMSLRVGQMIRPADSDTGLRNGFRLGIIRRIENSAVRERRVCVEILS